MDINILLFPDFETLDAFGPAEILGRVEGYRLRLISINGGVIKSLQGVEVLTARASDSDSGGILLIPGGMGTRSLINDRSFIEALSDAAEKSDYCLAVCTGSALLAKTGLLDGREATSNKRALEWVMSCAPDVRWLSHARWAVDGKFYTSSGVSAGMDMALGFIADRFGKYTSDKLADSIEYIWNSDMQNDPFAR